MLRAWNNGGGTVSSVRGFDILYLFSFLSFFLSFFFSFSFYSSPPPPSPFFSGVVFKPSSFTSLSLVQFHEPRVYFASGLGIIESFAFIDLFVPHKVH